MLCFQIALLCDVGTFFVTPPALRHSSSSCLPSSLCVFSGPLALTLLLDGYFLAFDSDLDLGLDFDAYLLDGLIGFGVTSVD